MPVDPEKIRTKLAFLGKKMQQLEQVRAGGREALLSDEILESAAVHWLQTAIEAALDIGNHILARGGLALPRTYKETVNYLRQHGIVSAEMEKELLDMAAFRNRAVHLYDRISPEEVADKVDRYLKNFETFTSAIVRRYVSDEGGNS